MSKIAVIGAGISGISIAKMLHASHEVTLYEKSEKVGGLVKCDIVQDVLFHKVGGHVFNAKNKQVFDWFWSHFDQEAEFLKAKRNAKILMNNRLIGYPIENYLYEFDKATVAQVITELLQIQNTAKRSPFEYGNFEDFLKGSFGPTLYDLYFKPYNQKIWNTDLSQVALEWLEGKLPMPNIHDIFLSNIVKQEEEGMVHATFFYPRQGGSQFVADRLANGLKIVKGQPIETIAHTGSGYLLNGTIEAEKVVYTGDIRRLGELYQAPSASLAHQLTDIKSLKSNGTSNMLCECDDNNLSWLYIPESFTRAHRIIYTGNFSPANNGQGRKTCVVEFSGKVEEATMREEIQKLPGNLKPLTYNQESNSYVIQDLHTRAKINQLKALLEPQGFYLLGRFAEWEYYNMDKAIEAAIELSQRMKQ